MNQGQGQGQSSFRRVIDLKLDTETLLTPHWPPVANGVAAGMRDAVPIWWSVVINIYAQAGLSVMTIEQVSKQAPSGSNSTFRTCCFNDASKPFGFGFGPDWAADLIYKFTFYLLTYLLFIAFWMYCRMS